MQNMTIQITTGTVVKVIFLLALAALLWHLRELVLIVLTSIVIASAIEPAAKGLIKYKIPRILSVLVVYLLFFAIFFGVVFFLVPPVLEETSSLLSTLPSYLENIGASGALTQDAIVETRSLISGISLGETTQQLDAILSGASSNFLAAMSLVFGGIISFILIVVFSFYFAVSERGIQEFLRVVTPIQHEEYVIDLWRRSQYKIGLWMQGQFLLAVIIGVLVYLGLSILGVPYALVLAVIAATLELIPVFGPILASIPAIAIGFTTGGLTTALIVTAFYLIIHQFENHLIYPLVVTKVVGVPPIMVILALLIGAKLAGILGILLSVPFAAIMQELFSDMDRKRRALQNGSR
jgi:predicted PurR-regulated permease PerM